MKKFYLSILFSVFIFSILFFAASAYAEDKNSGDELFEDYAVQQNNETVPDPLYLFNYGMYQFNDKLYFWLIKPVTKGYKSAVPLIVRSDIKNFFYNLLFPVRFVNSILQGKFSGAGSELAIFVMNSSAGCLGFGQPAQKLFKLKNSEEDLGQTMGSYSIGEGFYIVLPVLGPFTLRDLTGYLGDFFLKPVNYVDPYELSLGITGFDKINRTSFKLGDYKTLKDSSIDPYAAIKNAYIQFRREKTKH